MAAVAHRPPAPSPSPIPSSRSAQPTPDPIHPPHHATSFQRLRSTLGLRTAAARAKKSLPPPPTPIDDFATIKTPTASKGKERERIDSPPPVKSKGKEKEKDSKKEKEKAKAKEKENGKGKEQDKDRDKMNLMRRVATFRGRATPSPVPPPSQAPSPVPISKSTQNPIRRAGFTSFITPSIRQASMSSPTLSLSRAASPPTTAHHRARPAVPLAALTAAGAGPSAYSSSPAAAPPSPSPSPPTSSKAPAPTQARTKKASLQPPLPPTPSSPARAAREREIGAPMALGPKPKEGEGMDRKRAVKIPPSPSTPTVHLYHSPRTGTPTRGASVCRKEGGGAEREREKERERTRYNHDYELHDDDEPEFDMDSDASFSPPPTPTPAPRAQLGNSSPRASPITSRGLAHTHTNPNTSTPNSPNRRATSPAPSSPTLLRARTRSPSTPRGAPQLQSAQQSSPSQQQQAALRRGLTSASTSHLPMHGRSMSPPLTPTASPRRPSVDGTARRGLGDATGSSANGNGVGTTSARRGSIDSHAPVPPSPLASSPSMAARRPSMDATARRASGETPRRGSISTTTTPATASPTIMTPNPRDSPTAMRRRVSAAGTGSGHAPSPSPSMPLPATPTRASTTMSIPTFASASSSNSANGRHASPSPSPVRTRAVAPVQRSYASNRHFSVSSGSLLLGTTPIPPAPASPVRGHRAAHSLGSFSPPLPPTSSTMTTTGKSAPLGAAAARAVLRTAIGMIAREAGGRPPAHMCRTDQGLRDWEEVEVRVKELVWEEKVWRGKGGKDDGLKEEESAQRERRIFVEALRDGYVLCQLMNKLRASSIVRPDVREAAATANLTKFLAACASYGMAREDLFSPDDLLALDVDVETAKEKEAVARVAWTVVRLVRFVDEPESVRGKVGKENTNGHARENGNGNGNVNKGGGFTGGEKVWLRGQGLGREKEKEREREKERQREEEGRRREDGKDKKKDRDRDLPQTPTANTNGPYASGSVASRGGSASTPNLLATGFFNRTSSPARDGDRDRDHETGSPASPRKMRRWTPPEDMPPLRSNSPGELELELGGSGSSSGSPRTATMRDGGGNGKDKDKRGDAEQQGAEGAEATYTPRPVPRLMRPPPKSPLRGKADRLDNSAVANLLSWARNAAAPHSAGALSVALGRAHARQDDDEEEDEEEDEDFSELPGALALRGRPSFADSTRASIGDASVRDVDGANFRNAIQHHQRDSLHSSPSHHRDIYPQLQLQQQHSTTSTGTHTTSRSSNSPQQYGPPGFHFPARNVRQSVASSVLSADTEATTATTSAVSSLLDGFGGGGRSSSGGYFGGYGGGGSGGHNYGTIRTVTTEMTSEAPSVSRAEGNILAEEVKWKRSGMEMGGSGDNNNNNNNNNSAGGGGGTGGSASAILGMSGSPGGAKAMYGLGRERKMSGAPVPDLSRVAEETDESVSSKGHHTTSRGDRDRARDRERSPAQHQHRQLQSQSPHNKAEKQSPQVHLRKGKWPDDFVDAFHAPSPTQPVPLKRALTDNLRYGGGGEDEGRQRGTPPLSISPPRKLAIVGARRGEGEGLAPLPRRPTHRPRHSLDSSPVLLPKDALLCREASPDSTSSGSRVMLRRLSTKPGIVAGRQGAYSPLANGSDNASSPDSDGVSAAAGSTAAGATAPAPVPFPRSVSHTGTPSPRSSTGLDNVLPSDRPRLLRGRFQSDVEGSARSKARPSSYDELGARPPRSRFESMVNLGGSSAQASASDLLARDSMDGSAVRMRLIVREDGKPPTHFQLGNCIGKGQFGSVYRALNLNTGQMVAVKRIRLEGLKEEEVTTLMREVDLVKSLSHPSIVKYEGMARDDDTLNIVLEFAENGSLGQTIKAFGKLNERLVASYVVKILEGLHYLHTSDVVHCDLKAANILTTKNGNVKLSDFGVSLNLRAMEREKDVAGTPNWMAPEVIELKGASTKSDIWSLGCTVIELLTGHPPYAEITNAMTVMFRIVEDDIPPIPEDASEPLKDFLEQCFHKDPTRRPSAEELCEHAWLKNTWVALKDLRPQDSIPFLRRVSTDLHKSEVVRYLAQLDIPDSPISGSPKRVEGGKISPIARRTSAASVRPLENDFAPRDHTFVKTTFSKPVICRVCQLTVKKTAVLCSQCSLISHAKCKDNAPPTCDLRAHLLLYAQYAEKGNPASAYSNPNNEVGQHVAMSDVAFVEHNTPRTSIDSPQLPRSPALANNTVYPPTAFKFMAAFRRSRTSLTPEPAAPVVSPSSSETPPPPKDAADVPPARRRPAVLQKRPERPLSMTSDSTGLSSLRSAATAAESFSSRQNTGQRSQLSGGGRTVSDGAALDSRTRSSKITSSGRSEAPTEADRDNLGLPGSLPTNVGTKKKHKAKAASSGNCLVQ